MRHRQRLILFAVLVQAFFAVEHADGVVASGARSHLVLRASCDDGASIQASPNDAGEFDALAAFLRDHHASAGLALWIEVRSLPTAADWSWLATATSLEGFPDSLEHAHVEAPTESLLRALKQATGERSITTLALVGGELRESLGPAIDRLDVDALVLQSADLSNAASAVAGHAAKSVEAWNCTNVSAEAFAALQRGQQLERLAFFECATPDAHDPDGAPRIDLSGAPNLKYLDVAGLRGLRITASEIDVLRTRSWNGLGLWLASGPLDGGRERARIAALGDQPHLHTLRILSGALDVADVEWLASRSVLERLELVCVMVDGVLEPSDEPLRFARVAHLELDAIEGAPALLDAFGPLRALRALTLSDCESVSDGVVAKLAARVHPQLERLDLSGSGVTEECLVSIEAWPQLRFLDVQWTAISESVLAEFAARHPHIEIVGVSRGDRDH